jgi:hypothetical protein
MNPKKTKEKERRRARKLADQAWEAANDQNLDLAEKIIRRAVLTQPDNPSLWNDQGGFNALHRDLRGAVYFPIQMAVVLSPVAQTAVGDSDGFRGGEFLFCDVPESKKSQRREIPAGLGDMVLFCTRDRLVRVGGVYGLQPVKHGVNLITHGSRVVLGAPFHEYR